MVRKKVELKKRRKELVRAGKIKESDKVLEEYWALCGAKKVSKPEPSNKYSKEDLKTMSFSELRRIGYKFGTKDRSKSGLIKEILELQ